MKRLLFVLWAANLGGVQSSITTRIRALHRLGVKADVLLYYSGSGRETFQGVTTYVSNNKRTFAALVEKRAYTAVSFINVKPLVTALRGINYQGKLLYELRGMSTRGLSICADLSARDCGGIIVPSHYVAGLVRQAGHRTGVAVHVVHNAVDTNLFRPASEAVGDMPGHSSKRPILLWIGRLDWNKNFIELLRIILLLRKSGVGFSPWVVTDTNASKYMHRFRQALRLTNLVSEVRLLTNVPRKEMPELYNLTAQTGGCVLSTSRSEGLQNTLLEGMACGCPVVASAVGGNTEIVIDNVTGATYPLGRPAVAADRIGRLFAEEPLRRKYRAAGLKLIREKFSPERHARLFLCVLEKAPNMKRG